MEKLKALNTKYYIVFSYKYNYDKTIIYYL